MKEKLEKSRVLITGGAGFIGSNLVESMLEAGNSVVCLDNFSTGKRENLATFHDNPHFTLIEGDIRDYETCRKAASGVDYIFHHAALGSVPRSISDPISSIEVNIVGFVKMLHVAVELKIRRFIYATSSSVYGDHTGLPKIEEHIGKQLSPYALTKYFDELIAENFAKLYGIEVIGLRYFNVFGRRQDPESAYAAVIPKFVKTMMRHQSPVIYGDGSYSRDFTYIDNVILANHLAALSENKDALNTVFNIAHGEGTSLNDLLYMIRNYLGEYDKKVLDIEPSYGPVRAGDIPHSLGSVEKARMILGYSPVYNVEKGLRDAIGWYWNNL
jgi:UDP-N-acetylglucosamine 4-epimerase